MVDTLVETLKARLSPSGLDLVHGFEPGQMNRALADSGRPFRLPEGKAALIGNTRALWDKFSHARTTGTEGAMGSDPLDSYLTHHLKRATSDLPLSYLGFAHGDEKPIVPIQFLAAHSGLAEFGPFHLNIHPVYGPWFALRAVIVTAESSEAPSRARPFADPPRPASLGTASPCKKCSRPCLSPTPVHEPKSLSPRSLELLAPRVACPVGRDYMYGREQLTYHYQSAERFHKKNER